MAEKQVTPTFDSVMADLKAGKFMPTYLLMGDESYYIDRISDYIAEHALTTLGVLYGMLPLHSRSCATRHWHLSLKQVTCSTNVYKLGTM